MSNDEVLLSWERLLVTVDRVRLVGGRVVGEDQWSTGRLYEELVLAGVPLSYDERARWLTGHADWLDLVVVGAGCRVMVRTAAEPILVELTEEATRIVVDWYCEHVDFC